MPDTPSSAAGRGGWVEPDSPSGDADYIAARAPSLRVGRKGDDAGHLLSHQAADVDFRFHPEAGELPALAVGTLAPESTRGSADVALAEKMEQLIIAAGHDLSPLLHKRLRAGFGRNALLGAPVERLITLSQSLMAFWRDLGNARDHTCVVVMSEFGRRLQSNTSGGTDHGYGNAVMVLGGTVAGANCWAK